MSALKLSVKNKFKWILSTRYTTKRNYFYLFVTIAIIITPFIKIGNRRLFMLSFENRSLEFMGTLFDSSELYVIPLLIWAFAAWILMWTAWGGRVWCGWGCPQTMLRVVFRDLIQDKILGLRKRRDKIRSIKLNSLWRRIKFFLSYIIWVVVSLVIAANVSWFFMEPSRWFEIVFNWQYVDNKGIFNFWWAIAGFLVVDIIILKENFCRYICPYARIQSVFFDEFTALVIYDEKRGDNKDGSRGMKNLSGQLDKSGDCTNCGACVKICPANIDIRDGMQLACVECLECIDACKPVMDRKGVPNLINWTTHQKMEGGESKFLRPRPLIYAAMFLLSITVLFILKESKKDLSINLNHSGVTYELTKDSVENDFLLLFSNKLDKTREVNFIIKSEYDLQIVRPKGNITLLSDGKVRKTLILQLKTSELSKINSDDFGFTLEVYDIKDPLTLIDQAKGKFLLPKH